MSELADKVQAAADAMEAIKDRVIVEDEHGFRYAVDRIWAVGTRTDDPGVVINIVMRPYEPGGPPR